MKSKKSLEGKEVETFFSLVLDVYASFAKVMETGTPSEKKEATERFQEVQAMLASKLSDFQEEKGFDFKEIEKALESDQGATSHQFQEMKKTLTEYQKKLAPYAKKKKKRSTKNLGNRLEKRG